MNEKRSVFLAHNSQDKPQVKIIADKLNQKGIKTWLDEEQIPPGVSFQEYIQQAIKDIDCALIFIGKKGVGRWQEYEIRSFFTKLVESRIPVIPILLPGVHKIPDYLVFLNEINYVKFSDDIRDQNTINKIVWGITGKSSYINYDGLESFLRSGLWREANAETKRIILQSANREKDGYLHNEEMRDFDDNVLLQLDSLWQRYSQNRFGFSIQKKILQDCQQDASIFGSRVGWKQGDSWINEAHANYSLSAPLGHLPYGMLQLVDMNNAIAEGIVNAQWAVTKVLVTQDWQRQLISDAVGVFEWVSGNKNFNSGEFKKGLDFQLKHDEAWWQGERAEVMKIKNLCLLLFSCSLLDTVENSESSSSPFTDQTSEADISDKQSAGFSQVNTGNGSSWQVNVSGGTVNINPPDR
jgi:GUN4-like/TIR domain